MVWYGGVSVGVVGREIMERAALGDIVKIGKSYASAQGHVDVCDSYGTGGHFFSQGRTSQAYVPWGFNCGDR